MLINSEWGLTTEIDNSAKVEYLTLKHVAIMIKLT